MDKKRRAVYQLHIDALKPLIDQDLKQCRDHRASGQRPPEALLITLRENWQRLVDLFCIIYEVEPNE